MKDDAACIYRDISGSATRDISPLPCFCLVAMQERLQMTKEIARIKQLDQKVAEDKVRRAAIMAGEVEKINTAQVERKRAVAEREILEDAMIAEYVRQRDLREQVGTTMSGCSSS